MKWRETELSPKPHRFSLFWNTAENPFLLPPAPCGLRVLPRTRELLLSPRRSPAPFEVSDLRALLFPPAMSTPTTLGWYCRVNSSLLQKKLGEAGSIYTGSRLAQRAAPASFGSPSVWREPAAAQLPGLDAGWDSGGAKNPTGWVSAYKVDVHRSLEAGGRPSLLPQAPGVREQQSVTIWLPFGDPWLFSAQLQHIREGEGSCLAWCFCK